MLLKYVRIHFEMRTGENEVRVEAIEKIEEYGEITSLLTDTMIDSTFLKILGRMTVNCSEIYSSIVILDLTMLKLIPLSSKENLLLVFGKEREGGVEKGNGNTTSFMKTNRDRLIWYQTKSVWVILFILYRKSKLMKCNYFRNQLTTLFLPTHPLRGYSAYN